MVDPVNDAKWRNAVAVMTDGVHWNDDIQLENSNADTLSLAVKVLKSAYVIEAIEHHHMQQCIIFCRSRLQHHGALLAGAWL